MNERQTPNLCEVIGTIAAKIRRYEGTPLREQNTKAALIDPILEALGWDIHDPDEVFREFKPRPSDNPVDYALQLLRKPRLFVEAKGLHENLSDRKWVGQVLSYATVAGVEWAVLTDGDEYRFYNAGAPVDAEEKLFRQVRLSESDAQEAAKILGLISRSNMEGNSIDLLWDAHFVDRRVKASLRTLFDTVDKRLVRLVRRLEPKLTRKQVFESIRRLDFKITSSTALPPSAPAPEAVDSGRTAAAKKAWQTRRAASGVASADKDGEAGSSADPTRKKRVFYRASLQHLISAGLLKANLKLEREFRGQQLEAELQADGSVVFERTAYDSCSTAAAAARGKVMGGAPPTNGWRFWQYRDSKDGLVELDTARQLFLNRNAEKG